MIAAPRRPTVRSTRRLAAVLGLVALVLGCTPAPPSQTGGALRSGAAKSVCTATAEGFAPDRGLGGTGGPIAIATRGIGGIGAPTQLADRGIGGTGAPVRLADRGIGGTGAPIGVKGTITGFASVCVNGLEIGYDAAARVDIDGIYLPVTELRVGQVVSLLADNGRGVMMATDIMMRHAVSGPIDDVDNGGINLVVAGQTVLLGVASPGADQLRPGQWLEVSGLRDPAGYIVAARADLREPGQVVITGLVAGRLGALRIGGARLRGSLPDSVINTSISVSGDYADGVLTVHHIVAAERPPAQAGVIYVEAFAKATQTADGTPALQIGDDITAVIAPGFGAVPGGSTLLVVALQQSASGGLTALAQYDGHSDSGTSPVATPALALAPHATTTTAIATSTTASTTAGARAAGTPASAKAVATGSSKAASTGATATGTSAASKGGTNNATGANSGSGAAGKGGSAGSSSGGASSGGASGSGSGSGGHGSGASGAGATGGGGGSSSGGHGAAAPATK